MTALISAALSAWGKFNDNPPLDIGIEDGIVWLIVKAPYAGVNGYVMVPAEGHAWSNGFPNGEDSDKDVERSRRNLRVLSDAIQRDPSPQSVAQAMGTEDYEPYPGGEYGLDMLDVHGGVTWHQHPWIGFDTCHSFDVWGPEYDPHGFTTQYLPPGRYCKTWTPELVAEEARKLARQVAAIPLNVEVIELPPPGELET